MRIRWRQVCLVRLKVWLLVLYVDVTALNVTFIKKKVSQQIDKSMRGNLKNNEPLVLPSRIKCHKDQCWHCLVA